MRETAVNLSTSAICITLLALACGPPGPTIRIECWELDDDGRLTRIEATVEEPGREPVRVWSTLGAHWRHIDGGGDVSDDLDTALAMRVGETVSRLVSELSPEQYPRCDRVEIRGNHIWIDPCSTIEFE